MDGERVRVASTGSAVVLSESVGGGRDVRVPGVRHRHHRRHHGRRLLSRGQRWQRWPLGLRAAAPGWPMRSPHWPSFGEVLPERQGPGTRLGWHRAERRHAVRQAARPHREGRFNCAPSSIRRARRCSFGRPAHRTPMAPPPTWCRSGATNRWPSTSTETIARLWAQTLTVDPFVRRDRPGQGGVGRAWSRSRRRAGCGCSMPPLCRPSCRPAPNKRIPLVSLGTATELEGNDPNARTVRVPFTLNEKARQRSSFVVRVASYERAPSAPT